MSNTKEDKIVHDEATGRITVTTWDGREYILCSYQNTHLTHQRGAFTLGDISSVKMRKATKLKVLKMFYPDDSLRYLAEHGYIAN